MKQMIKECPGVGGRGCEKAIVDGGDHSRSSLSC
jgi:hypothetical protein